MSNIVKPSKDERLGFRTKEGQITRWPECYATNKLAAFSRVQNPTPTQVWIGKSHFYVLPIGSGRLDDKIRTELEEEVGKSITKVKKEEIESKESVIQSNDTKK